MKVLILNDIIRGLQQPITFIEAGEYEIVREFDSTRWLINLNKSPLRKLTLVYKNDCVILS
jgi:hypothetical protein